MYKSWHLKPFILCIKP